MISDASPLHMARDLVARHSDIGFIRGYIINYFGKAPAREKIEALRAEHVAAQEKARNYLDYFDMKRREMVKAADQRRSAARKRAA